MVLLHRSAFQQASPQLVLVPGMHCLEKIQVRKEVGIVTRVLVAALSNRLTGLSGKSALISVYLSKCIKVTD